MRIMHVRVEITPQRGINLFVFANRGLANADELNGAAVKVWWRTKKIGDALRERKYRISKSKWTQSRLHLMIVESWNVFLAS